MQLHVEVLAQMNPLRITRQNLRWAFVRFHNSPLSFRQRLTQGFRKKRSGSDTEQVNRTDDQRSFAVGSKVGDERTRRERPQKRNKPRCVETEAHCGCSNMCRI